LFNPSAELDGGGCSGGAIDDEDGGDVVRSDGLMLYWCTLEYFEFLVDDGLVRELESLLPPLPLALAVVVALP